MFNKNIVSRYKLVIIVTFIVLAVILIIDFLIFRDRIYPGVHLNGVDLGGRTVCEVSEQIDALDIQFYGPQDEVVTIPPEELGIFIDEKKVKKEAYQVGRDIAYPFNMLIRARLLLSGHTIQVYYDFDEATFNKNFESLVEKMQKKPQNATFQVQKDQIDIIPSESGYRVDQTELKALITDMTRQNKFKSKITLPYQVEHPDVKTEDIEEKNITDLRASYCTHFNPHEEGRVHNIQLAAETLDYYEIPPGGYFSFNNVIGNTTKEKGYREAPIMVGDRLQPGIGGGICQVSSTLYNVFLEGDLKIIERYNHNMLVDYIEPGRDATIAYYTYDLVVRNEDTHPMLISAKVKNDTLCFKLFGGPMDKEIDIETSILETTPYNVVYKENEELNPGEEKVIQEGAYGHHVKVEKIISHSEDPTRELVSWDRYLPRKEIIHRSPQKK